VGDALTVSIDGQAQETVHDTTLSATGSVGIAANKNGSFRHVEYVPLDEAEAAGSAAWTAVDLRNGGWIADGDGFTTDKPIRGYNAIESDTRDAAVRMTYRLRDASGVQITARGRAMNGKIEKYVAEDELGALQIGRMMPNGSVKPLVKETYPPGLTRESEHTLEFRIMGGTLSATLNGTFSLTANDDTLKDGSWAMVLKKGAQVKRLEVQTPQANGSGVSDSRVSASGASSGKVIDLLPLVDLKRDSIAGNWSRSTDGVSVALFDGASILQLPYRPPVEYDFEIEFTPNDAGGNVNQYLAAAGHSFAWKLNAHYVTPPLYGFELLDGRFCKDFGEAATHFPAAIETGHRYRSTVEVRRGGLRGLLDGKELVKWSGDFNRLSQEGITRMRDEDHLGIGSWRRPITFHKATVREVSGAGTVDAPPVSPKP